MKTRVISIAAVGVMLSLRIMVMPAWAKGCPDDSVQSGTVCMDKYEASVWLVPPMEKKLIGKIQKGTATLADLQRAGAVELGLATGDLSANGCPSTGNGCLDVYAVSIPEVTPAAFITWFQAAAAARNSFKRLATNQEWQVAALGTPDTGGADDQSTTCNTDTLVPGVAPTGSRSACASDVGAFDMIGNVSEWVADWGDLANDCTSWSPRFGDDLSCVGGPGSGFSNLPGAFLRGGSWGFRTFAGVFAVRAGADPSFASFNVGFRCARYSYEPLTM
jgi:hypothetical protein